MVAVEPKLAALAMHPSMMRHLHGCVVQIGQDVVDSLCTHRKMDEKDNACEWMKMKMEAEEGIRESLVNGKLVQLYIQKEFGMVATSNNTHKCSGSCRMIEVQGESFQVNGNPDVLHVHLLHPVVHCTAPPVWQSAMHSRSRKHLKGQVYVCSESGNAHVCTERDCDGDTMETEAGMCCVLTGNVVAVNRKLYKHDWMEDSKYSGGQRTTSDTQRTLRAKIDNTDNGRVTRALCTIAELVPVGENDTEMLDTAIDVLVNKAESILTELFPGSDTRKLIEEEEDAYTLKMLYLQYYRYIKNRKENNRPVMLDQLDKITMHTSKCDEVRSSRPRITVTRPKIREISHGYARGIVRYLQSLIKHTAYKVSTVNAYVNYVLAILYLQQHLFCLQGVEIFTGDTFLQCMLPNQPSTLWRYTEGVKPNLTQTKNKIQKTISTAIVTHGALPINLQYPRLSYAEVFT